MPAKGHKKRNAQTCRIGIRCTEKEFRAISKRADACGLTVSEYLRSLAKWHVKEKAVEEAPKVRLARVGEAQMAKLMPLLTELTRNGNNLNQLAKQANTGMVPVTRTELRDVLGRLNGLLDDLQKIVEPSLT
jgi:hypothetical protein